MVKWNATRAPAGRVAYVNGRYLPHTRAGVHIEDRALQLGDGIYEVAGITAGRLIDEEPHLDRMERSLREIGMAMPMGRAALKLVMREMASRNRVRDGLLYMQVSRGAVRRDHPIPEIVPRPTLIMTVRAQDPRIGEKKRLEGIAVITRPDQRWARRDIKTVQLLPNLLAKTEARKAGAYEAWFVDNEGFVTEGASTNAWIVDNDNHVVTRRVILEAAAAAGMPITERKFTVEEALKAKEAFLSSASGAAIPVIKIDETIVGSGAPGPLTRQIHALYAQ